MPKQNKNDFVVKSPLRIQGAKIVSRNFAGRATPYNRQGERNFNVLLDEETAEVLKRDGWNVKWFKITQPDQEPQAFLPVEVAFNKYPPEILQITQDGKTYIGEEEVHLLDGADVKNVDLIIRPYNWEVNGKTGVKAYLKSLFITIEEDEFARKYRNIPFTSSKPTEVDDEDIPF